MANSQRYRVYRIPEPLRKAIKAKREAHNVTTRDVLEGAVSESLPKVVAALHGVGFRMAKGPVRPVRWPVGDEEGLLGSLAVASKQTGIPASRLLLASVALFTQKGGKR